MQLFRTQLGHFPFWSVINAVICLGLAVHAGADEAAVAQAELDAALAAVAKNEQLLKSAVGVADFESWSQKVDEKYPTLMKKAELEIYFDDGRYHIGMTLLHNMVRMPQVDSEGKKSKPILFILKPAEHYFVNNEKEIQVVRFSEQLKPIGCSGDIYPLEAAHIAFQSISLPWQEPARLWKDCSDLTKLIENLGRKSILLGRAKDLRGFTVTHTAGQSYVELNVSSESGNQIVSRRTYSSKQQDPVRSHDLEWEQKDGVWYVKSMTEEWDNRRMNPARGSYSKSTIRFTSFEVNKPVDPKLFTLASIRIPVGTRFIDIYSHQPKATFRYFDGVKLSTTRVAREQ